MLTDSIIDRAFQEPESDIHTLRDLEEPEKEALVTHLLFEKERYKTWLKEIETEERAEVREERRQFTANDQKELLEIFITH